MNVAIEEGVTVFNLGAAVMNRGNHGQQQRALRIVNSLVLLRELVPYDPQMEDMIEALRQYLLARAQDLTNECRTENP